VKADELNCKEVPTVIVSVLVTVSAVLAMIPRLQPLMKEPAMAKTSLGWRGMSNGCGMGGVPMNMFKMVW